MWSPDDCEDLHAGSLGLASVCKEEPGERLRLHGGRGWLWLMSACVLTHGQQVLAMSREPVVFDLSLLDGSDLKEAELVKNSVCQQLNSDRGGTVLPSLVDFYLETSSSQALTLLSTIREHLHKALLDKLNDALNKAATRLAALTLLGHLTRKQPPWVHLIIRCPLLASLLRCLKTDGDIVVLTTGVLVLVTLLPMIPQCGKQLVYDFFDVFGRLASWSLRNPAQVPVLQLLHLQGALYSLSHRLYGMFPVNFLSYLRLHYSMKENRDTFHVVVKPMLDHVRVHPELVTGTQDQELDPNRWRCYEVHDIMMECSRLSLDPLEATSEDLLCSDPIPPVPSVPPISETALRQSPCPTKSIDLSWSPSSHCGLSTPPPEGHTHPPPEPPPASSPLGPGHSPSAGVKCPSDASVPITPPPKQPPVAHSSQTIKVQNGSDGINSQSEEPQKPRLLTASPISSSSATSGPATSVSNQSHQSYEALFELALPRAAPLFIARKTKEALQKAELDHSPVSPLELLDQLKPVEDRLVLQGDHAHHLLLKSVVNRCVDRSSSGTPPPGVIHPAPIQVPDLTSGLVSMEELSTELLLVQNQLQFERFKRQQHALRNRRLLRRVINTTALEEQTHAMRAQLGLMEAEVRSLRASLEEEQRCFVELKQNSDRTTSDLQDHIQDLSLGLQGALRDKALLQSELQQCQSRLKEQEADLQRANHEAYNAQHLLAQLSIKVSSWEELQQHLHLMNQQMALLRETNRALTQALTKSETGSETEASLLQCIMGNEVQHLKQNEVQLRQALESTNQRAADLEEQLSLKEQLILDQKRLLEESKALSRSELSASESRCVALRCITHTLQTELLQLYSHLHLRPGLNQDQHQDQDQDQQWGFSRPRPSASVNISNSANSHLSPLYSPPVESPLTVGSFLEREARRLFGTANQSPEPEEPANHSPDPEEPANHSPDPEELDNYSPESKEPANPSLESDQQTNQNREEEETANHSPEEEGQEVQEEMLLAGSPQNWAPVGQRPSPDSTHTTQGPAQTIPGRSHSDLALSVRRRRQELSLMDYNETGLES